MILLYQLNWCIQCRDIVGGNQISVCTDQLPGHAWYVYFIADKFIHVHVACIKIIISSLVYSVPRRNALSTLLEDGDIST